jgi:hypothetical protein
MLKTKLYLLPFICIGIAILMATAGCKKIPHCEYLVCRNGGNCQADTCACPPGYVGALCETSVRGQFLGTYVGTLKFTSPLGTDSLPNISIVVTAGTDSSTEVTLSSSKLGGSLNGVVSAAGGLNIPSQSNTLGSISASGSFYGNTLSFSYSQNVVITTIPGTFIGTKQ